ncbi:MAG: HAMP domain-containing histidine kinase [Lachnospiraceae bacterium]|nr:HAMP domain-containing histidine kinase [Lachnospiraceae bacterium]
MDKKFSLKKVYIVLTLLFVIILLCTYAFLYSLTSDLKIFLLFTNFVILLLAWVAILLYSIFHKLTLFTNELHRTLDNMIDGNISFFEEKYNETLLSQINHHLYRLYNILEVAKNSANKERLRLQELISDISHQLKTLMTTLRLTESSMERDILDPNKLRSLLHTNTLLLNKLEFLLLSLVKISRLETGIITLFPSYQAIGNTILTALENVVLAATKKKIEIVFHYSDEYKAYHDSKWTSEALYNILDNAVKYTNENGHISIEVSTLELYTKISIKDSGIGIKESGIPHIFQRFYRSPSVKNLPGVGIGLHLAHDIITRQYGFIHVLSTPNIGSTFEVFLVNGDSPN